VKVKYRVIVSNKPDPCIIPKNPLGTKSRKQEREFRVECRVNYRYLIQEQNHVGKVGFDRQSMMISITEYQPTSKS
jgi:hypothetical protein